MNTSLIAKDFFIFPVLLFTFCTPPEKPKAENYHELIQKVIAQDESYLHAFKKEHEKNWDDKNWKLMNSRIDAFETGLEIKGEKETTVLDTNCILEWNHQLSGKIKRETYNSKFIAENIEFLHYKNDSVFARGTLGYFPNSKEKLLQLTFFRKKIACKPCNEFSYMDYVSSGASTGIQYEEYQILDSLDNVECSYYSPKFTMWNWEEKQGKIKVIFYSDSIITADGTCSFVELEEKYEMQ